MVRESSRKAVIVASKETMIQEVSTQEHTVVDALPQSERRDALPEKTTGVEAC